MGASGEPHTERSSEAKLTLRYGRSAVAYLDARADVPGLPAVIPVESNVARVEAFVRNAPRAPPQADGTYCSTRSTRDVRRSF